jgi:hypothetical protein
MLHHSFAQLSSHANSYIERLIYSRADMHKLFPTLESSTQTTIAPSFLALCNWCSILVFEVTDSVVKFTCPHYF